MMHDDSGVWLSRWLLLAAALRTFSVWIGFFSPVKFQVALFRAKPEVVTDAFGRLFGTWTLVTCVLCIVCSFNIHNAAIYGATLASFVIALAYMANELLVHRTLDVKGATSPMSIAAISTAWMLYEYSTLTGRAAS